MSNEWMKKAACKGQTHKMFPKGHKDITYLREARPICRGCPVRTQCLDYALQFPVTDMHGIWAGMTQRQLAREQKLRGIEPTKPTLAQLFIELTGDA